MTVEEGEDFEDVRYVYRAPGREEKVYKSHEVFVLNGFSENGLRGLSPLGTCLDAVGLGQALDEYAARFFAHGAWMGGLFSRDLSMEELSDEEFKDLGRKIESRYVGSAEAHKPLFVDGITYEKTVANPEESQALDSRKFFVLDVARILGIPPQQLMAFEHSNRSTAAEQGRMFKQSLSPWGERWVQGVDTQLLTEGERRAGYFSTIVYAKLEETDIETTSRALSNYVRSALMTPNEARTVIDMNRLPGDQGDQVMWAANMVPADQADEILGGGDGDEDESDDGSSGDSDDNSEAEEDDENEGA
jgi:HK97 family phage portal protein